MINASKGPIEPLDSVKMRERLPGGLFQLEPPFRYTTAAMTERMQLIVDYQEQAGQLVRLTSECSDEQAARRPAAERWSILEIIGHLADAELLAAVRIRRLLTQDRAKFYGYRQNEWATRLGYQEQSLDEVVARFTLLRRSNGRLLERIAADDWKLTGEHDENGTLALDQLIEGYIDHTAKHLTQVRGLIGE